MNNLSRPPREVQPDATLRDYALAVAGMAAAMEFALIQMELTGMTQNAIYPVLKLAFDDFLKVHGPAPKWGETS